jgi:hypothetical protein
MLRIAVGWILQGLTLCQAENHLCGFPRERGLTQGQALRL